MKQNVNCELQANNKKEKKKLHFDYVDPHEVSRKQDRMRRFAQVLLVLYF